MQTIILSSYIGWCSKKLTQKETYSKPSCGINLCFAFERDGWIVLPLPAIVTTRSLTIITCFEGNTFSFKLLTTTETGDNPRDSNHIFCSGKGWDGKRKNHSNMKSEKHWEIHSRLKKNYLLLSYYLTSQIREESCRNQGDQMPTRRLKWWERGFAG